MRAHFLLHALARLGATVDIVSLIHDDEEASHAGDLDALASSVRVVPVPRRLNTMKSVLALPGRRPTTHTMFDSPDLMPSLRAATASRRPDVVVAYCSGVAHLALSEPLADVPLVLDMVDVDSKKWEALAAVTAPPLSWVYHREARVLRRFEARIATHAQVNLVTTEREREALLGVAASARVEVMPNGVDVDALRPPSPPTDSPVVIFCGVLNYAPNEHAATLLAKDVWPLVRRHCPAARLMLVGSHPTAAVRALAHEGDGIVVTGAVPDVRPHLWSAAVSAAPIVTARGIQNKVLEAVAAGLPTVVTPNIFESLPSSVKAACVAADGASALADAIVSLLQLSPTERRARAARADLRSMTWEHQFAPLGGWLDQAMTGSRTATHSA